MLRSLVIKTEYRRALHQNVIPAYRLPVIPSLPATNEPSISNAPAAFLTETDAHSEIDVTHSKQTVATFLTGARIARTATVSSAAPRAEACDGKM